MVLLRGAGAPRESLDGLVHVVEGPLLNSFGRVSGWSGSRPATRLELSRCSHSEQYLGKRPTR